MLFTHTVYVSYTADANKATLEGRVVVLLYSNWQILVQNLSNIFYFHVGCLCAVLDYAETIRLPPNPEYQAILDQN